MTYCNFWDQSFFFSPAAKIMRTMRCCVAQIFSNRLLESWWVSSTEGFADDAPQWRVGNGGGVASQFFRSWWIFKSLFMPKYQLSFPFSTVLLPFSSFLVKLLRHWPVTCLGHSEWRGRPAVRCPKTTALKLDHCALDLPGEVDDWWCWCTLDG